MAETNINWVLVETVKVGKNNFYYWQHVVDALGINDFSPKYYICKEVIIHNYPNKTFISKSDLLKLCKEQLGELNIMPGVIVKKEVEEVSL